MNEVSCCATPPLLPVIGGRLLDACLDEIEALETGADESAVREKLGSLLRRQRCEPEDMEGLQRFYRLCLRNGEAAAALAMIEAQGGRVRAGLPADEQALAGVSLAFWRLDCLRSLAAVPGSALAETASLLGALPASEQSDEAWGYLADHAEDAGDHECVRQCAMKRHALATGQPERARFRAWDDAFLMLRLGRSYAAQGLPEKVRSAVDSAIDSLKRAPADQDVDHDDWLGLGEQAIALLPECFGRIRDEVRAHLVADECAPPLRRAAEVQLARLEALALYRQGRLTEALEKSRAGRFGLSDDSDEDEFSMQVLDWLLEAGRAAEAARLAFECAFNERGESAPHACRLALQQMQQLPDEAGGDGANGAAGGAAEWALTLAFAATCEELQWVAGDAAPTDFFERHLALARRYSPAHPGADVLQALYLIRERQAYAEALPLLEKAVLHAELSAPNVLEALWLSRIHRHGAAPGLAMPYPDAAAAGWCYNMGVWLNFQLRDHFPEDMAWPEAAIESLAARYYESGLKKFEAFIVSGSGMFRDGDLHVYSMLCNNLAIHYRQERKDYAAAALTHAKGIAASPFAEHYNGLMWCHYLADRDEDSVAAADALWHYAADHGFGRHCPPDYVGWVCCTLQTLGRDGEIAIWLQRLDEWWDELDAEDQAEAQADYLDTLTMVLWQMGVTRSDDALLRLERALPAIRALKQPACCRQAGGVLDLAGEHPRALELYREARALLDRQGKAADQALRQSVQEDVARLEKLLRLRPWWKFWN